MKRIRQNLGSDSGFSLLEVLVAVSVLAISMLALNSVAIATVKNNGVAREYMEATVLAQSTIESLRYTGFELGLNQLISADMTPTGHPLSNPLTTSDNSTDTAALFASPDHAYTYSNGAEQLPLLDSPSLTTSSSLRRAWIVRDNIPANGMKAITVIIGWKMGSQDHYVTVSTAIQGE